MGFVSKPNPARNPPGAEGLAHHRAIQMPNGRDDLPLNRAMGESRSNGAPRSPGPLGGGSPPRWRIFGPPLINQRIRP